MALFKALKICVHLQVLLAVVRHDIICECDVRRRYALKCVCIQPNRWPAVWYVRACVRVSARHDVCRQTYGLLRVQQVGGDWLGDVYMRVSAWVMRVSSNLWSPSGAVVRRCRRAEAVQRRRRRRAAYASLPSAFARESFYPVEYVWKFSITRTHALLQLSLENHFMSICEHTSAHACKHKKQFT